MQTIAGLIPVVGTQWGNNGASAQMEPQRVTVSECLFLTETIGAADPNMKETITVGAIAVMDATLRATSTKTETAMVY
ncbi:uncharacterized protein N7459_006923 [Penicillium hispanicum]|uniref:uncharacterized protein n=1 Tax=Penicillium hispanicum TaxID=1080232 RepID=UPI00253F6C8C|nr:uncharacterized protein N7459_006923 [Penicillium hispanicum]KAJ5577959.1 hypothetical protein N7459_006923 [Penicillium hispanicum]